MTNDSKNALRIVVAVVAFVVGLFLGGGVFFFVLQLSNFVLIELGLQLGFFIGVAAFGLIFLIGILIIGKNDPLEDYTAVEKRMIRKRATEIFHTIYLPNHEILFMIVPAVVLGGALVVGAVSLICEYWFVFFSMLLFLFVGGYLLVKEQNRIEGYALEDAKKEYDEKFKY